MKGEGLSQKWDGDSLLTPKRTSPFALQSIFSTLSIPEPPPFTGNIVSPGDFDAQAGGDDFGVKG
jgi:hypothetical protein